MSMSPLGFGIVPRKRLHIGELQLTAMIDIMTVLVIFLLQTMSFTQVQVDVGGRLELPMGGAIDSAQDSDNVMISKDGISFQGKEIVRLQLAADGTSKIIDDLELSDGGSTITKLFDELVAQRENGLTIAKARGEEVPQNRINLVADKDTNYEVIRRVLWTAAKAQYVNYQLTVERAPETN